jgi:hypothetical protein
MPARQAAALCVGRRSDAPPDDHEGEHTDAEGEDDDESVFCNACRNVSLYADSFEYDLS